MALIEEKPSSSSLSFLTDNAISTAIADTYSNLSEKRRALGLENPGTVDSISREVQREVLLSNYMFSGLRCDLQKVFSVAPLFRLQHGFSMGSQAMPPWQLMALYGTPRVRFYLQCLAKSVTDSRPGIHARRLLERSIHYRVGQSTNIRQACGQNSDPDRPKTRADHGAIR